MATATRPSPTDGHARRSAADVRVPSMEFLSFEDNGGDCHWAIVVGDGATLAWSGGFASYDCAKHAVEQIRHGVVSARFEAGAAWARPIDLIVRRNPSGEDSNAERWMDAGGSFSNEAVAT